LSVERLGEASDRAPFDERQNLERIKEYMQRWAENTTRWNRQALDKPANGFEFVIDRDSDGALRDQIYILGHFDLPDADTAVVLDVDLGGAEYFIAPITNVWGTTNDIVTRNGCLNLQQSMPNPDGRYTFVLSLRDPGVHNWLDPNDMPQGILTLRWAEFPGGRPDANCGVKSRLESLDSLPADLPRVTPAEREEQLSRRAASYAWRLAQQEQG
ncbi:MAG: hypothetical protein ACPG1A_16550, partial [Halioglobus sp.]